MKDRLKRWFLDELRRVADNDEARWIAASAIRPLLTWRPDAPRVSTAGSPYPELGDVGDHVERVRDDLIFLTARFRTGSTLLWHLFAQLSDCTAYYEPLNPRLGLGQKLRGLPASSSHRHVSEYWREYEEIRDIGQIYQRRFHERDLFMDENAWDPELRRYIEILAGHAPKRPVFQFNRVDFRLGWLRRTFPKATIVHMYRHPREQWCSAIKTFSLVPLHARLADFSPTDLYFLGAWVDDLRYRFPFLDATRECHPYRAFYFLWKLSYLFGLHYADCSLAFEDLIVDADEQLARMFAAVGIHTYDLDTLKSTIMRPEADRWKQYASHEWFVEHEAACEGTLQEFL